MTRTATPTKAEKPAKKEEAKPKVKAKPEEKPMTPAERMKKCRIEQERIDALEHKLEGAKENVKELASQLKQSKKRLREDLLDIPQGTFGFKDGEDPADEKGE